MLDYTPGPASPQLAEGTALRLRALLAPGNGTSAGRIAAESEPAEFREFPDELIDVDNGGGVAVSRVGEASSVMRGATSSPTNDDWHCIPWFAAT